MDDKQHELESKVERFKESMLTEFKKNDPQKGSILDFTNFESIITELEYHKAKLMMAMRVDNKQAVKEYIADTANFLFALGNIGGLYEDDFPDVNDNESFEINKDVEIFQKTTTPSVNQQIDFGK